MDKVEISVFAHRGIIGIQGINVMPKGLGCVEEVTKDNLKITQEAYDLLLTIKGSNDDMGTIDCFKAGDKTIFGWLGGPLGLFDPKETDSGNDFDFTLLKDMVDENLEVDVEFAKAVDGILDGAEA